MTNLRDMFDPTKTVEVKKKAVKNRDDERQRIRDKMPTDVREFCDKVREIFPGARLTFVEFDDGETIGKQL